MYNPMTFLSTTLMNIVSLNGSRFWGSDRTSCIAVISQFKRFLGEGKAKEQNSFVKSLNNLTKHEETLEKSTVTSLLGVETHFKAFP